jgi:hypothetical protein
VSDLLAKKKEIDQASLRDSEDPSVEQSMEVEKPKDTEPKVSVSDQYSEK